MIVAQGTDGVPRGFLALGVMTGEAMSAFIPIHKSVLQQSPNSYYGRNCGLAKEAWFLNPGTGSRRATI
jgi:hypothetical protein